MVGDRESCVYVGLLKTEVTEERLDDQVLLCVVSGMSYLNKVTFGLLCGRHSE